MPRQLLVNSWRGTNQNQRLQVALRLANTRVVTVLISVPKCLNLETRWWWGCVLDHSEEVTDRTVAAELCDGSNRSEL